MTAVNITNIAQKESRDIFIVSLSAVVNQCSEMVYSSYIEFLGILATVTMIPQTDFILEESDNPTYFCIQPKVKNVSESISDLLVRIKAESKEFEIQYPTSW